jgi:hypothetical protein
MKNLKMFQMANKTYPNSAKENCKLIQPLRTPQTWYTKPISPNSGLSFKQIGTTSSVTNSWSIFRKGAPNYALHDCSVTIQPRA